eukprot:TRINITY_DN13427_c0_g2_i1.p1 TRINITY_DN13427_c0_g2~~TRINITY_DN13427_c0_g2_i1.p1  ORF type:complete len:235 (+),score=21.20 TRINITY_DN13427_c0_g2_i1:255-959(+)
MAWLGAVPLQRIRGCSPILLFCVLVFSTVIAAQGRPGDVGEWFVLPSLYGSPEGQCGPESQIEIPKCEVTQKTRGYELRRYPDGQMWATTVVQDETYDSAKATGFYRCFYYISGKNTNSEVVEMTAPVLIRSIQPGKTYSISFFVPSRYNATSVPQPLADYVSITHPKSSTKAVLGPFGGFPNEQVYNAKWQQLKAMLKRDGVAFDESSVVFAGYSSPFTFLNRKQELWVDVFP